MVTKKFLKAKFDCNRKAKKPPNYGKLNSFFPAHIGNHACVTQQKWPQGAMCAGPQCCKMFSEVILSTANFCICLAIWNDADCNKFDGYCDSYPNSNSK